MPRTLRMLLECSYCGLIIDNFVADLRKKRKCGPLFFSFPSANKADLTTDLAVVTMALQSSEHVSRAQFRQEIRASDKKASTFYDDSFTIGGSWLTEDK